MLHCYFDDSGTHAGSRLAVWAGVAGASGHFFELDKRWRALLRTPLPGKPPLTKFGLRDCARGKGEFFGYNEGERDRVRFLFRQAILESGMHPFSFAVDALEWNRIVTGEMRAAYACGAGGVAFSACADIALKLAAKMPQSQMACVFDKGQRSPELLSLLEDTESRGTAEGVSSLTYAFAAVADVTGLQAADTIATEHYWYGLECLKEDNPPLPPHLRAFVTKRMTRAYMLKRPEILGLRKAFRAAQKQH